MIYNSGVDFMQIYGFVKNKIPKEKDWEWIIQKIIDLWGYKYYHFLNDIEFYNLRDTRNILKKIHENGIYPKGFFVIQRKTPFEVISSMLQEIGGFAFELKKASLALKVGYFSYNFISCSTCQSIRGLVQLSPLASTYLLKMYLDSLIISDIGDIWYHFVERRTKPPIYFYDEEFENLKNILIKHKITLKDLKNIKMPKKEIKDYHEQFPLQGIMGFQFKHPDYICFNYRDEESEIIKEELQKIPHVFIRKPNEKSQHDIF